MHEGFNVVLVETVRRTESSIASLTNLQKLMEVHQKGLNQEGAEDLRQGVWGRSHNAQLQISYYHTDFRWSEVQKQISNLVEEVLANQDHGLDSVALSAICCMCIHHKMIQLHCWLCKNSTKEFGRWIDLNSGENRLTQSLSSEPMIMPDRSRASGDLEAMLGIPGDLRDKACDW